MPSTRSLDARPTSATSGDYVLPVPMTDLQKKVNSAVVSSNFSEILSYFDGSKQSRIKYQEKTKRMMSDMDLVATHPYLLLKHLQPPLSHKRAPHQLESVSGKFQSLVALCRQFTRSDQNIAIVCEAGHLTDMVEVVLADRGLRVQRYSDKPAVKLYKKEIAKRRGPAFHLVPSRFEHLMQAVYAAFDLVVLLDNTFDVGSDYGRGLRAQLRVPAKRTPLAPILRLVALNSAQHIELLPSLSFGDQIATTVVQKDQVGALPSLARSYYARDLAPLQPFLKDPDGPYPLPSLEAVNIATHKDVEQALYLDDEDQYQVEFTNRGSSRRLRREINNDSEDDESSDEVQITKLKTEDKGEEHSRPRKIRKVDIEEETRELLAGVSDGLTFDLLAKLNDALSANRGFAGEIASHRELASKRELLVEDERNSIMMLARQIRDMERQRTDSERKMEKLRARNEKIELELYNKELWWDRLAEKLGAKSPQAENGDASSGQADATPNAPVDGPENTNTVSPAASSEGGPATSGTAPAAADGIDRLRILTDELAAAESRADQLQRDVANEKSRFAHLQSVSSASSEYADRLASERDALQTEVDELKARLHTGPEAKDAQLQQQLEARDVELDAVRAQFSNLESSVRAQLARERTTQRGDRRGRGRGGRHVSP